MKPLIVITGPTACGKTPAAVALAKMINGEVVSADSMQIYRGMDIGTAKPTRAEMAGIPHHMIDVADPTEDYSVARYVTEAAACVEDIRARGKLPILVGGTGLYIDSLLSGRDFAPRGTMEDDRPYGMDVWQALQKIDPEAAARLHPNDRKRVTRALEVYRLTGQTITEHNRMTQTLPPRYRALKIALTAEERPALYARIEGRVDAMVAAGLQGEVEALLQAGLTPRHTAMQAIGYQEMAEVLRGDTTLDEAITMIKQESRRYAKRQLSWLRRDPTVNWIHWDREPDFPKAVQRSTEFCHAAGIIGR